MRKILLFIIILISPNLSAQKRFLTIDSTKIWINELGIENRKVGQPVVVFESGLGTPMDNWDRVLTGVSVLAPVVTYDRPGIGASEPDNEMPTIKNVSDKLIKILNHLGIAPPYILVGHSLGGAYVRGFAVYYPNLLAGLVIIDPADFTETKLNKRKPYLDIGLTNEQVDTLFKKWQNEDEGNKNNPTSKPKSIIKEDEVLAQLRETDFKEITNSKLPNIPVHILTGGRYDTPQRFRIKELNDSLLFRAKMENRVDRWTDVIQSVDKGMLFYSGDAGHFVQWDDPELLISSIRIVLQDYELLKGKKQTSHSDGWGNKLVTIFARHLDNFIVTNNLSLMCQIRDFGSGQILQPRQFYLSPGLAEIAPWWLARRDSFSAKVPGHVSADGATNVYSLNRRAVVYNAKNQQACKFIKIY